MSLREDRARPKFAAPSSVSRKLLQSLRAAAVRLSEWLTSRANRYAAARMYECLSRLSDAELERRGFSRSRLAHDLFPMGGRARETSTATTVMARTQAARAEAAGACARPVNSSRR
jgi:hypothetical protein